MSTLNSCAFNHTSSGGSGGGGASELVDLTDVSTSTPTNRFVLVANGVDWESRVLTEADISNLGTYLTDAPSDGSTYGRNNGAWIISGGAGVPFVETATNNLGVGENAVNSITTGDHNSGLGYEAGTSVTTGSYNTFMGSLSGDLVNTGSDNTAVGYISLSASINSSADYNTAIGSRSCENLGSNQSNNSCVGAFSSQGTSSGGHNCYLGVYTGMNKTSGSYNVMIGSSAGQNSGTGSYCVFIGRSAGSSETGNSKFIIASNGDYLLNGDFVNKWLEVDGDLLPYTHNTRDIGSAAKAWKSIILEDTTDGNTYKIEVISGVITATVVV